MANRRAAFLEELRSKASSSKSNNKKCIVQLQQDLHILPPEEEESNPKFVKETDTERKCVLQLQQDLHISPPEEEESNPKYVKEAYTEWDVLDSDDSDRDPTYYPKIDSTCVSSDEEIQVSKKCRYLNKLPEMCTDVQPDGNPTYNDEGDQAAVSEVLDGIITRVIEIKKKSRKKTRSQREESKNLRNLGKSYVSESGKVIKCRELIDLSPCRIKCKERLRNDIRLKIFNEYWALGSRNQRANFVSSHITISKIKTRKVDPKNKNRMCSCSYYFYVENEKYPVCKKCFLTTLGETRGFIEIIIRQKQLSPCSIVAPDRRGKGPSGNQRSEAEIKDVKDHIASFPTYESHYCRQTSSKKYLSGDLNITKMYKLYAKTKQNPVSINFYANCFHSLNLSFKMPKNDTCYTCDLFKAQIQSATTEEDKAGIIEKRDVHHKMAEFAYDSKKEDKAEAKSNPKHRVFSFDLQQCLPTPFLKTSVAFYKRQLWTFNLTIHDLVSDVGYCYVWDESVSGRGANQIASCLFEQLKMLPPDTEEVTFYSDTCGGQNKNNIVATMFLYAMHKLPINVVNHKFLVSGHTHMECDSDHAAIEKAKKSTSLKINHCNDWIQLIRLCKTKNPFNVIPMVKEKFLDFTSLSKKGGPFIIKKLDTNNEKYLWKPVQWLQYHQGSGNIHFKHSLEKTESFKMLNFKRKGKHLISNHLPLVSLGSNPISNEKKRDILSLLPLIDPAFHEFYKNLTTNNDPPIDPDLIEIEID